MSDIAKLVQEARRPRLRHGAARRGLNKTQLGKTYAAWSLMKYRCQNPRCPAYKDYGGRGIEVCQRWHRFDNFLADMGEKPIGGTLDRIDNNGPYSPGNCRWATHIIQCNNTRRTVYFSHAGVTQPLTVWAKKLGIDPNTLRHRFKMGWSPAKALTTPKLTEFDKRQAQQLANGESKAEGLT